ncbi:MAG TPA: lipopolysaccharide assembly protein LapA domain-containing protein, partial [Acidimicrobiales bacterium]|nr:lipopolysaccharide assembly protein LapA domain-containing protein [Acidimicrobiales bacterium]
MSGDSEGVNEPVDNAGGVASSPSDLAPSDQHAVGHTRTSAAWVATVVVVLFLVALIDFIAQNTRHVRVEFFGLHGAIPVAVALLAAAVAGAIVVLAIGVARVAQLRLSMRRTRRGFR